jgi:hypothetical protein
MATVQVAAQQPGYPPAPGRARILGTSAGSFESAEDRHKFNALLHSWARWEHVAYASDAELRLGGAGTPKLYQKPQMGPPDQIRNEDYVR